MAEPIRLANANLNKSFIPTLKPLESRGTGYVGLSASPMYMSGFNDKVCVSTKMPTGQSHYNGLGWS